MEPGDVGIGSGTRNSDGSLRESQTAIERERRKHEPGINRRRVKGGSKGKAGKAGRVVRNIDNTRRHSGTSVVTKTKGNQMTELKKIGTDSITTARCFQISLVGAVRDMPTQRGNELGRAEEGCMLQEQVAEEVTATSFEVRRSLDRRSSRNEQINSVGQTTNGNADKGIG